MFPPTVPGGFPPCASCGTEVAPGLLACPVCGALVHAADLKILAAEAARAEESGDLAGALGRWREALARLPPDSRQYEVIAGRISDLGRRVDRLPAGGGGGAAPGAAGKHGAPAALAGLGALGLLLWKFKFVLGFLLTKGKILLLGLTKGGTLFSMILSMGVYWAAWGWKFAVGLVLSIYVHEMGHVVALRKLGIPATAPMFIPGLGAFVRMKAYPTTPREDSRVGLAGPIWGLGASLAAYGVFLLTGWGSWGAIAQVGAWINLFNLLPLKPLDGGRGFESLTRSQRWGVVAVMAAMWGVTEEGLLALLLLVGIGRAVAGRAPVETDWIGFAQFVVLVVTLSGLCTIALSA